MPSIAARGRRCGGWIRRRRTDLSRCCDGRQCCPPRGRWLNLRSAEGEELDVSALEPALELRVAVENDDAAIDGLRVRRTLLVGSVVPMAGIPGVSAVEARLLCFHGWEYVSSNGRGRLGRDGRIERSGGIEGGRDQRTGRLVSLSTVYMSRNLSPSPHASGRAWRMIFIACPALLASCQLRLHDPDSIAGSPLDGAVGPAMWLDRRTS